MPEKTLPEDLAAFLPRAFPHRKGWGRPPVIPGTVCVRWVKCGKPGCKCAAGELHGPYYHLRRRVGDRVKQSYVRKSEVEAVRDLCRFRQALQAQARQNRRDNERMMRAFRDVLRPLEAAQRGRGRG